MIEVADSKDRQIQSSSKSNDQNGSESAAVEVLIRLFNDTFRSSHNTVLVKGLDEPFYQPADQDNPYHQIIFAHGFFNSALHEIAHWCVAGPERRLLPDFGYWYEPDGRTLEQQKQFEIVEVKPQALEWILSKSCGRRFRVSSDNLGLAANGIVHDDSQFKQNVWREVQRRYQQGLPVRLATFANVLQEYFQPGILIGAEDYKLEDL
ncbi:MAG: elongation factor P hydroxylase [Pseudomonadales bacterium]|nr:elongation factor P hydroxylase [Pseudomonadales bacterium]